MIVQFLYRKQNFSDGFLFLAHSFRLRPLDLDLFKCEFIKDLAPFGCVVANRNSLYNGGWSGYKLYYTFLYTWFKLWFKTPHFLWPSH